MAAVNTVLVVGGGTTGCALATLLARAGVEVHVAEITTDRTAHGSGITLQGNALRVLDELGVLPQVRAVGFAFDGLGLRSYTGELLEEVSDTCSGTGDLPTTLGVDRPRLAAVLAEATERAGAHVRFGVTVRSLHQDDSGVDAVFSDGTEGRYDLVVGADGIHSTTRSLLGIEASPRSAGMTVWRVRARRPAGLERTDLCYDGPCYIAGYCPTGDDAIYAYLVEQEREHTQLSGADQVAVMRRLAADYHGFWDEIRDDIDDPERINQAIFESLLVPAPWNRGRVVIIGDAAHACPPTLAQGAAMCLEDASVLAEFLLGADRVDESLWQAFAERRFERVRTVVHGSLELVNSLRDPDATADVPGLLARVNAALSEPA